MKKRFSILLALCLALSMTVLVACNKEEPAVETSEVVPETSETKNEPETSEVTETSETDENIASETTDETEFQPLAATQSELTTELSTIYENAASSDTYPITDFASVNASCDGVIERTGFTNGTADFVVTIYEFNTQSDAYRSLTPDSELTISWTGNAGYNIPAGSETVPITAINKQYVISITTYDADGTTILLDPSTNTALQAVYDAFMAY